MRVLVLQKLAVSQGHRQCSLFLCVGRRQKAKREKEAKGDKGLIIRERNLSFSGLVENNGSETWEGRESNKLLRRLKNCEKKHSV